jgi:3-phenylpropionate/cinnamic acid dioxygenase small subunit
VTDEENDLLALFRELNLENRARLLDSARLYTYLEPVLAQAEFSMQAQREAAELIRDPRQCGEWIADDAYGRNARYCSRKATRDDGYCTQHHDRLERWPGLKAERESESGASGCQ